MAEIADALVPAPGYGDPDDVLRSLRRFAALALGAPPWKVRLQRTRVSDDERPVAVIDPGVLATPHSRAGTVRQGDVQKQQTFTIVCYPPVATTAAVASEEARKLTYRLDASFSRGLVTDDVPPVNIGAPWRIPVYTFEGVPIEGADRAGSPDPYMHANVDETFTVRVVQDPLDELRYTVVATLRMTWWQGGRVRPDAPLARGGIAGGWRPVRP